ncbi:hypothetical protein [uncultured Microscilla sp.]|uniref:hypothetical protein n=1 Tax=uncultured Microscilla sp. TaxID=432653 RepID=UPI0026381E23|nr:hypothetical protein [uncultured Microscilla sp.]
MVNKYNSFLDKKSDLLWASYTGDSSEFWRAYEKLIAASKKKALPPGFINKRKILPGRERMPEREYG